MRGSRGGSPVSADRPGDAPGAPSRRRRDVLGAVLAGGESRRMGRDKALLTLGAGPPLAERAARTMEEVLHRVVLVVAEAADERFPGRSLVTDRRPGRGPLAALDAALAAARGRPVLIAACDLPNLTPRVVRAVLGDEKIAHAMAESSTATVRVATDGERLQPLLALYSPGCQRPVTRALDAGRLALFRLLEDLTVTPVPVPAWALTNLNHPRDLAAARAETAGEVEEDAIDPQTNEPRGNPP